MGNRTFTQVPPDSTGDKLAMRNRKKGADTVLEQAVYIGEEETFIAVCDAVAPATNKSLACIFNATGSGVTVRIHEVLLHQLGLVAQTGVNARLELRRATAVSAGTTVTAEKFDTNNANLPAGVTVRHNGTVTDGNLLYPVVITNDESPLSGLPNYSQDKSIWKAMRGIRIQPFVLRENEGLTVKNVTNTTVGTWAVVIVFSVEAAHADV
jgi:hypothetical protein